MTDPLEVVGLPVGGPTTTPLLKAQLNIDLDDARDDAKLDTMVAAANSVVRTFAIAEQAVGQPAWPDRIVQGATQLAARLYRRKGSPAGVEAFGSDGAVYVARTDPDISMLLQLGSWQAPSVG